MADQYTQQNSPLRLKVADLGDDDLLITRLTGSEAISELFRFELDLLAPFDKPVPFENVLGKSAVVSIDVPGGKPRLFQGIVTRFAQGNPTKRFMTYRATLMPMVWLLTKRVQSRIFQHVSVPEILGSVFEGFKVTFRLHGKFHSRDYCVQYRESDFAFASRLMEEEGIFYYFSQADDAEMVLCNSQYAHEIIPSPATVIFDEILGGNRGDDEEGRVNGWQKVQEVRASQVTLWDHHFELPDKHLEADQKIQESVTVGQVNHKLNLTISDDLEMYDYPGGFAGRFDGINRGGGEQPSELEKIFEDNRRTVRLRILEEAAGAVSVDGKGDCRQFITGYKFTLERHIDADGDYIITRVSHNAGLGAGGYDTGSAAEGFEYSNEFRCIPAGLPFCPPRVTPRPSVKGTQTAVVVGPAGDEIFTDKYGRIKVQFPWDRAGKYDADSSCWIRVATIWAGKGWGVIHIPRIGQEVVVDFLEGDPDQPIVIGSVYNADQMPPGELPKEGMVSGLQSRSTPKGGPSNFNGMRANDTKGKEALNVQAEYDMTTLVKHDDTQTVVNDRTITVTGKHTESIKADTSITVLKGNFSHDVQTGTSFVHVKGAVEEKYEATQLTTVTGAVSEKYNSTLETIVKDGIHIASTAADIYIQAAKSIQLHVGASNIWMDSGGQVTIKGNNIMIDGKETVTIHGGMVRSNADTSHEIGSDGNAKSVAKANNVVSGAMVMLNPG